MRVMSGGAPYQNIDQCSSMIVISGGALVGYQNIDQCRSIRVTSGRALGGVVSAVVEGVNWVPRMQQYESDEPQGA